MEKLYTEEDLRKAYKAGVSQAGGDLEGDF